MAKKIDRCQEQVADLENKWKRAMADYANLEKRLDKEKESFVRFANAALLLKVLVLFDDLVLVQKHIKDGGLSLVIKKFKDVLANEDMEEVCIIGQEFDPGCMEAVEKVPGEKNKVVEICSTGYRMGDKVLRPAKVKVGQD